MQTGRTSASQLVGEAETLMLTTVDGEGRVTSRPMAFVPGAFDGGLWLFTDEASPEALGVQAHPQVSAAFAVRRARH
jgi:general stress protein 26